MGGSASSSPAVQKSLANFMDAAMGGLGPISKDKPKHGIEKLMQSYVANGERPDGMTAPGNLNLYKRPRVYNKDEGGVSTVYSEGRNVNGEEVLLPRVVGNKILSSDDALKHYLKTGEHLGKFSDAKSSSDYAEALHLQQQALTAKPAFDQYTKQFRNMPDAAIRGVGDAVASIPDMAIAAGKLAMEGGFNPRMGQSERVKRFADTTYMPINPMMQDALTRAGVAETEGGNNLTRFVSGAMAPYALGKYAGAVGDAVGAAERGALGNAERGMVKLTDDLPMDEASRMGRADEMFPIDAYHGSPRNIKEFKSNKYGTPEGHYGANNYFSSSIDDVNENYAGEGPDLTGRIERRLEEFSDGQNDDDILDYWTNKDVDAESIDDLSQGQIEEASREIAKASLGIENQGTVYPVRLSMKNPVVVGGEKETFFDYEYKVNDRGDFDGESGLAIDLIDKTKKTMREWGASDHDIDDVVTKVGEQMSDGGISASEYERIVRSNVNELYDDMTNEMASPGALIADVYKKMGYDGVNMDAHQAFNERRGFGGAKLQGMSGVYPDTRHYITFGDNQARSRFAKFDPKKRDSSDLLAAGLPLSAFVGEKDDTPFDRLKRKFKGAK